MAAPATEQETGGDKDVDWLFAPVPFSSPTTGFGIAGGVVAFYNPNGGPHQWMTGGGAMWTSRGSRGIGAFHKLSSADDRFRLDATLNLLNQENDFYGIGEEAGDLGDALRIQDKGINVKVRAMMRVIPNGYLGGRYILATHDAAPVEEQDPSTTLPPPLDEMDSTSSMLGPVFAYDTRNDQDQPESGVFVNGAWLFGVDLLGNTFDHNKLSLTGAAYHRVGRNTVLAGKASLCSVGGEVPYYDLCLFGASADLRGYPAGRYRDEASWAVQAELRHSLSTRWGIIGFVGLGGIAPSFGGLIDDGNLLPGAGGGVRYRPFKDNNVQLRVDFAVGKNDTGIYVGIGEAF